MNTDSMSSPVRQVAVNGLAVVGFVALVTAGLWLAIYSTRFVPTVVDRIGAAAVYLGSVFTAAPASTLSVVPTPTASTTISFGTDSASTTTTTVTTTKPVETPVQPAATEVTKPDSTNTGSNTYQIVANQPVAPHGLADLEVKVISTGYLTQASTDSFVASTTVPNGYRPAIRFTVDNVGTNWSGTWTFSIDFPLSRTPVASAFEKCESVTSGVQRCTSYPQPSLAAGDSIEYIAGFDRPTTGANQTITVNVAPTGTESNTNNNTTTANITVLGS